MESCNIEYKQGNILDSKNTFIIQQCNCITLTAKGLAQQIEEKFPVVDVYRRRKHSTLGTIKDTPGTFRLYENVSGTNDGVDSVHIVCLFGQYYPGQSKGSNDSYEKRIQWFKTALWSFGNHLKTKHLLNNKVCVAFPFRIGCGLAGGDWNVYENVIREFAIQFQHILTCKIYKQ